MVDIPESYFEWQCTQRRKNLVGMLKKSTRKEMGMSGQYMPYAMLALHDPVMATVNPDTLEINCAPKGVGIVLATEEAMQDFIDEAEALIEKAYDLGLKETLEERVQLLLDHIYPDMGDEPDWGSHYNLGSVGTIEIYGGTTYANVLKHPHASMQYNGFAGGNGYFSQELKVEVVMHEAGSVFYDYFIGLHDLFHVPPEKMRHTRKDPGRYSCVYELKATEVRDKAPGKNAGKPIT